MAPSDVPLFPGFPRQDHHLPLQQTGFKSGSPRPLLFHWKRRCSGAGWWGWVVVLAPGLWTTQAMEFSRPEYWSGYPFPSPGDLPHPGIEPRSPALQVNSLLVEPPGKPIMLWMEEQVRKKMGKAAEYIGLQRWLSSYSCAGFWCTLGFLSLKCVRQVTWKGSECQEGSWETVNWRGSGEVAYFFYERPESECFKLCIS